MTREEIMALQPGLEMDRAVAETMGWKDIKVKHIPGHGCDGMDALEGTLDGWSRREIIPWYSTDLKDAWYVVERLKDDGDFFLEWWQDGEWTVSNKPLGVRDCGFTVVAPTVQQAVCRALLVIRHLW